MTDAAFKRQQIRLPVEIVIRNHCTSGKESIYGKKYEIIALVGPNGQRRWLRSIWMIRANESFARFVTLIPEKKT